MCQFNEKNAMASYVAPSNAQPSRPQSIHQIQNMAGDVSVLLVGCVSSSPLSNSSFYFNWSSVVEQKLKIYWSVWPLMRAHCSHCSSTGAFDQLLLLLQRLCGCVNVFLLFPFVCVVIGPPWVLFHFVVFSLTVGILRRVVQSSKVISFRYAAHSVSLQCVASGWFDTRFECETKAISFIHCSLLWIHSFIRSESIR